MRGVEFVLWIILIGGLTWVVMWDYMRRQRKMRCDSCGKFRKSEDLEPYQKVSHDRLEAWWVMICKQCRGVKTGETNE